MKLKEANVVFITQTMSKLKEVDRKTNRRKTSYINKGVRFIQNE